MSRPVLYLAITNHGFGHAVRMATIANQVQKLNPDILLILVTTAPRWLLESYIEGDFIYRYRAFDVGVIQSDSLTMDLAATLAKMKEYRLREKEIVATEVEFININQVSLILADIPAMAATIAEKAGIPCWMMSNFGWDFIYRAWGDEFTEIADWLTRRYQKCQRLFRLPLAEEMASFPLIENMGLTGGIPRYSEAKLREKFNLFTEKEKTILLTFGGLGIEAIPYENLSRFPHYQFITFATNAPDLPNLFKVTDKCDRPVDFMPICGRVMSKPGFSTFAESMRLEIPLISVTREGFAEAEILLQGLKDYSYHNIVNYQDFFEGNWDFLNQELLPPQSNDKIAKNGTEIIAKEVVNFFDN
ncbi:MAG: glycosyl transferase [Cyanobacteria bacterium]|nr:glycosyl transferase [Cyanobacteria bacterium CG_2015-16_32_12]NCO78623.1 glycosyl transferase [Cyanobacteria bacterium CG_2015-22_32_23]NCQ04676.1 glycosyl transferase [Cyanobacteria bacterium CG_2015-09_32_10]NCQ42147.1 glycosyl transferase [Cyanobacteria bacterium CG_2015-04_32_10]NCS86130.1 glycosyl transferase [Cyanobacteria bacterium CG_2015-02_32_10]